MTKVVPAFDETLSDLKAVLSVTCDITRSEATAERQMMATVTLPATTLHNILTAASLHNYDEEDKFVAKPGADEYNDASRQYYWDQRDCIDYLTGQLSVATSPDYGDSKEQSIATSRKCRHSMYLAHKAAEKAGQPAPEKPKTTAEELKEKFEALNPSPLKAGEVVGLMVKLMENPDREVSWDVAMRLFESFRQVSAEKEKVNERLAAVERALRGY